MKDINGHDSIIIKIIDKGYSNEQIIYFLKNFIFQFLCLIAIIIIFDIIIINKYILKRLLNLTKFMEKVSETKDTTLTINMSGKDEINKLADATNKMLSAT